jgi:hypothetical protein
MGNESKREHPNATGARAAFGHAAVRLACAIALQGMAASVMAQPAQKAAPQQASAEPRRRPSIFDSIFEPDSAPAYEGDGRPPMRVGPGLRAAPGLGIRVSGDEGAAFVFDLTASGRIGAYPGDSQWVIAPELGYSFRSPGDEHSISMGVGLGYGEGDSAPQGDARTLFGGLCYIPRIVFDFTDPKTNLGFRHGLLYHFRENFFVIELSHQYVRRKAEDLNDLRLTIGLDVGLLLLRAAL